VLKITQEIVFSSHNYLDVILNISMIIGQNVRVVNEIIGITIPRDLEGKSWKPCL